MPRDHLFHGLATATGGVTMPRDHLSTVWLRLLAVSLCLGSIFSTVWLLTCRLHPKGRVGNSVIVNFEGLLGLLHPNILL